MAGDGIHTIAELVTILFAFGGGMVWVTKSVKNGKKEQMAAHKSDFRKVRKELKRRVSTDECDRLRAQCPCNAQNQKQGGVK